MSKASDDINCMNCCIGDFKRRLCHCDGEFYAKFKGIGNMDDFIRKVMNACENTCEIERKSNASGDLISRQDAVEAINALNNGLLYTHMDYVDAVRSVPSAERTGEWIPYNEGQEGWQRTDGSPIFMSCSLCNGTVVNNFSAHWNFCPNCGARMVSEE